LEDDIVYGALNSNDEETVFALNYGDYLTSDYNVIVYKINSNTGDYIDSCFIYFNYAAYKLNYVSNIFFIEQEVFILIGQCENINTGDKQIFIVKLNEGLEIIGEFIVGDEVIDEYFFDVIYSTDSLLVFSGKDEMGITIEERDTEGNLIREKTYSQNGTLASTLIEIPSLNKYHLFRYWDTNHSFNIIDKDSLNVDTVIMYPQRLLPRNAIIGLDSSYYYVAGRELDIYPFTYGDFLAFIKVTNTGQIIDHNTYKIDDKITYYTSQSFTVNPDAIYFGGSYPCTWDPPLFFYPEQRWILLYKLNHDGEILWQKFYKGEVNYMAYKILATSDGGALIFSTRYDWNDSIPNQRDVHILKIDSTGYYNPITGTQEEIAKDQKQILVYPNPSTSEITFVTGLYSGLELSVYNSTGEKVISLPLPSGQTFDISHFPSGVYFYVITGKKGFSESGKIIKR